MIETNIRIIEPGMKFSLDVRCVEVTAQDLTPDLLETICSKLQSSDYAAVKRNKDILVLSSKPINAKTFSDNNCCAEIRDTSTPLTLRLSESCDIDLITQLVERKLLLEIRKREKYWRLGNSNRIWYEMEPFMKMRGVQAYRRYEVSAIFIDSVGIGVAVDVGTGFFTIDSVADFFTKTVSVEEQNKRKKLFEKLSERQKGQKGTLCYDIGNEKKRICYFESFIFDKTCDSTGSIFIQNKQYESLYHYYNEKYPNLQIEPEDSVAKVSFQGLGSVFVAAKLLRLRVMNEMLPYELSNVDKIEPQKRRELIQCFWNHIGDQQGCVLKFNNGFWQPEKERIFSNRPPSLEFNDKKILSFSSNGNPIKHLKDHFYKRLGLLDQIGCFYVPKTIPHEICFVIPAETSKEMVQRLTTDMCSYLSNWTNKKLSAQILFYSGLEEAIADLRDFTPGLSVFVFKDDDPANYFFISHELKNWRIKRITFRELYKRFNSLGQQEGKGPQHIKSNDRFIRNWESFVRMSCLDVLQQIDCVPWTFAENLNYEAQLAIDVGWDRRHFSISMLLCRPDSEPSFWLKSITHVKADPKHETINRCHLKDAVIEIMKPLEQKDVKPIKSIICWRDGRECGDELKAILDARKELITLDVLTNDCRIDVVDVGKNSMKGIRAWWISNKGKVSNVLEGESINLGNGAVLVFNTGSATINQRTAEPVILHIPQNVNVRPVVSDFNAGSHLNYSSPSVAQKLPLVLKRTDEQLRNKAAQEIKRIR
ncbi:MAG: hypothetical protein ACE5KZ_13905 [Candidatus Scalinduaceae bacterium]